MVISGRGSSRDIEQALQTIDAKRHAATQLKQQWEQTHEVSTNKEGSPESPHSVVGQSSNKFREDIPTVVSKTDRG